MIAYLIFLTLLFVAGAYTEGDITAFVLFLILGIGFVLNKVINEVKELRRIKKVVIIKTPKKRMGL